MTEGRRPASSRARTAPHHRCHRATSTCGRQRNPLMIRHGGGIRLGRREGLPVLSTGAAGRRAQHGQGGVRRKTGVLRQSLHPLTGAGYRVEVLPKAKNVEQCAKHVTDYARPKDRTTESWAIRAEDLSTWAYPARQRTTRRGQAPDGDSSADSGRSYYAGGSCRGPSGPRSSRGSSRPVNSGCRSPSAASSDSPGSSAGARSNDECSALAPSLPCSP